MLIMYRLSDIHTKVEMSCKAFSYYVQKINPPKLMSSYAVRLRLCSIHMCVCVQWSTKGGFGGLTLQRGVTGGARIAKTPCRGVTGTARHMQALIHSFISRQQREQL
jgi:hypothetical protein